MKWSLVAVVALVAVPAFAQESHPCQEDAKKLCAGIEPGQGRILACLKQHEAELSQACRARRAEFREEAQELHAACRADAQKICPGLRPGHGLFACMGQHRGELSGDCRKAMGERRERREHAREEWRESCGADARKVCAGVKPGGGRIVACLKQHASELSPACRERLE